MLAHPCITLSSKINGVMLSSLDQHNAVMMSHVVMFLSLAHTVMQ